MSDPTDGPPNDGPPNEGDRPTAPNGEPIGSVGEEAAKLFVALSGWAKDQGSASAETAAGAASAVSEAVQNLNEHVATGGEDCKYCPLCQVISAVRSTSPEVKAHLAVAASSLMHAAAGVLATQVPSDAKKGPVEKIDLDGDGGWDE